MRCAEVLHPQRGGRLLGSETHKGTIAREPHRQLEVLTGCDSPGQTSVPMASIRVNNDERKNNVNYIPPKVKSREL
jgi:hypothetical protein